MEETLEDIIRHNKRYIEQQTIAFENREDIRQARKAIRDAYRLTYEDCPDCKKGKLVPQRGGGVACDMKKCNYWFCY